MSPPAATAAAPKVPARAQVKETLISLIIAFVMAFVFRAFVIEAFIIPTGSMAPTLDGAHVTVVSPNTGYRWDVNPQDPPGTPGAPLPVQGPMRLEEPMTRERLVRTQPLLAGDRILVFKYLYSVYDPRRWDVVVFKAPHEPQTNYIKRLLALPGEMPAIIDGDLFVRRPGAGETQSGDQDPWMLPGWQVQRKPERVQRAVWQDIFWSQYEPLDPSVTDEVAHARYRTPWAGQGPGWQVEGRRDYEFSGAGPATLAWDNARRPIVDWYAYNTNGQPERPRSEMYGPRTFPVSDVNMALTVEPGAGVQALSAAAIIDTRRHEFRAEIAGTQVVLKSGLLGEPDASGTRAPPASFEQIGSGSLPRALAAGSMTTLEFWHVDQSVQLWADGKLVARADYDWSPDERLRFAMGITADAVFNRDKGSLHQPPGTTALLEYYEQPHLRWEFSGGPFTLHRVGLQRDLHYQAGYRFRENGTPQPLGPARQTSPATTTILGPDHFFVCGDNNPSSLDARLWRDSDPWVREQIDPTPGIVPRDLMIGRAFFVYFPSLIRGRWGLPVPDFGHMRWIW
jgi:signal peptidase I